MTFSERAITALSLYAGAMFTAIVLALALEIAKKVG